MKIEIDLADLEALLDIADEYVYWHDWSLEIVNRVEEAINKVKEKTNVN